MFEWILAFYLMLRAYHHLYFFMVRRRIKGPIKLMKDASPFSRRRGKKVAMLIHGFTSSPGEFKRLGNYLAKKGISVHAPLLPGHGTAPERLALVKYVEWVEALEKEIALLEQDYEDIYLVGNSLGGNLALIVANKSKKIKGIVALGTPMFFHHERKSKYIAFPILRRIKIFQRKRYKSEYEQKLSEKRGSGTYMSIPLKSLVQVIKVVNLSKNILKKIKKPITVIQARKDPISRKESAKFILDNVKSKKKELVTLPLDYHFLLYDKAGTITNKKILEFIRKN